MRTDSGTVEDNIYHVLFGRIPYKYGKYRTLVGPLLVQVRHINTRQIWQWDSTCATVVSLDSKAQVG